VAKTRLGRPALALAGIVVAAGLAYTLWPNGEYRPIQPGEKGTAGEIFEAVSAIGTGRPGLTPEREAELGGAPARAWTVAENAPPAQREADPGTATTTPTTARPAVSTSAPPTSSPATSAPVRATTTTVAGTTTTARSTGTSLVPTTTIP
jgi:hypothetical protein